MQIDYSSLVSKNAIVLDELPSIATGLSAELVKYLNQGGTVVVVPDSAIDFSSYSRFFSALNIPPITALVMNSERVDKLMLEDPVFKDVFSKSPSSANNVDMPQVQGYFVQGQGRSSGETLMKLRSGTSLLSRYRIGKGEVYVFMAPFSGNLSNLARHAIFVPVMYRIALLSEQTGKLAYAIGRDDQIELPAVSLTGDHVFHLTNDNLKFDVIPAHRSTGSGTMIMLNNQVVNAGNYKLTAADKIITTPSFNFNRDESVMSFLDGEELTEMIGKLRIKNVSVIQPETAEITAGLSVMNEGIRLWKYCLIMVLIFLAIEIMLLKFWKQ